MNFEDLQKAWQSQDQGAKVLINADALLKEVRRNQQHFWATIFWRDVRETGVAFLLAIFFLWHGPNGDWTDRLLVLACFGVGAFMIADRIRQRRKRPASADPLKACLEGSRNEVRHQIWLLRKIGWWYLLPLGAALAVSIARTILRSASFSASAISGWSAYVIFCLVLFWSIYWLNQKVVRTDLQPRLQELEALLADLP
jgi:hypothetical protein